MNGIIGHEAIQRELLQLARADEPAHALLFAGAEGTGRRRLALLYAMALNCERAAPPPAGASLFGDALPPVEGEIPCGTCRACRLIADEQYADIVTVGPGDTLCHPRPGESSHAAHPTSRDIRICQVRGMIDLASRYPFEARYRVIIVDPAERLGREAANTLLKTLEEPPGHTIFALLSSAPDAIIETILSRCRRIEVRPAARQTIEAGLLAHGIAPDLAARAAAESRGKPGLALAFAARPSLMEDRDRLLARCARIAAERMGARFAYAEDLAGRYRRDRETTLNELDAWEAFWEERLRISAREGDREMGVETLTALRAVSQAREDLQANVLGRAALELMLLSFPRVMLTEVPALPGEFEE